LATALLALSPLTFAGDISSVDDAHSLTIPAGSSVLSEIESNRTRGRAIVPPISNPPEGGNRYWQSGETFYKFENNNNNDYPHS
ncbi:MAG: hypothetical protein AB8B97_24905, partial [Granulosicoccus sp.]